MSEHQPIGIRSTEFGPFIRCACGRNPTPKYWLEYHWGDDKAEGKRLVDELLGEHYSNPREGR